MVSRCFMFMYFLQPPLGSGYMTKPCADQHQRRIRYNKMRHLNDIFHIYDYTFLPRLSFCKFKNLLPHLSQNITKIHRNSGRITVDFYWWT